MHTAQTITPRSQAFTPFGRNVTILLVVILGAAFGVGAAFAIDQLRAPGTDAPTSQADGFSTQTYAELSAPQGFSTQQYAAQHD
jgi:hypothetical protein